MENIKIAFIGCGNMGRSLIGGMLANGFPAKNISAVDISEAHRSKVASNFKIETFSEATPAIRGADVVVLAIKPQSMRATLKSLSDILETEKPLLLSIAAGIQTSAIARWSGYDAAIVRVMPNTPSLVRTGAAGLYANENTDEHQKTLAESIIRSVGMTIWVDQENLIDSVTALSGSGPAYFFYFMEVMEKAGIDLGLSEEQARNLTLQTALGAAKMALESDLDPADLRKQVTSPGGTTEKALGIMYKKNLDAIIIAAIEAAADRARELAITLGDE
jgi:pyrroline-5-carboxylate reductase